MRILSNVNNNGTTSPLLKFKDRLFTSLTMLGLEVKASTCSTIKENLILYCRKFSGISVCYRKLTYFNNDLFHKETQLDIIKFAIESSVFQNRLLDGAHSALLASTALLSGYTRF